MRKELPYVVTVKHFYQIYFLSAKFIRYKGWGIICIQCPLNFLFRKLQFISG